MDLMRDMPPDATADDWDKAVYTCLFGTEIGWAPEPKSKSRKPKPKKTPTFLIGRP